MSDLIDWADVMAYAVVARADPSGGMATVASCRFGRMLLDSVAEALRRAWLDGQMDANRCPHQARNGRHEWYATTTHHVCRACGARGPSHD